MKDKIKKAVVAFALSLMLIISSIWTGIPWTNTAFAAGEKNTITPSSTSGTMTITLTIAAATYNVTYDANGATGGTVPVDSDNHESGSSVTVLGNTGSLIRDGYNFNGWNTAADGTGTNYAAGGSFNISSDTTLYAQWVAKQNISYTVTFGVVNGSWDDGTTADKTVNLSGYEGDELFLKAGDIPSVGNRPNDEFKSGSWNITPSVSIAITGNTAYTYTYAPKDGISSTVIFKVVNGQWDDGTTADKVVTLTGHEGDTLKLSSEQIPAVGNKPSDGYKAGSWDVTPSTDTAISSNVTYTYTYVADSSGGSSDSGSGDSSGGSSDSGSGSSSSGSTDGGSGSSSGGSSDSGNTGGGTSSGSSDNTNTNTDTSAKVPYDDVATSTGSVNDITGTAAATAESNPFGTKIENSSNLTNLLSLTDAEVAQGVNVWLDIQDMSASVPQTDKTLIQNTSGDYTVGLYLDINLFKKVGSNDATKVTETNGKVKASIVIPESLWKSGRTFEIIRVHDGVATAIAGTYDENTHVFTFETDKFSTYALAYKDPASSSNSGTTSNSSSSNSSNSTQSTAPKTGDPNDIRVWYMLLIASLGGLGYLGYSKKKKVND